MTPARRWVAGLLLVAVAGAIVVAEWVRPRPGRPGGGAALPSVAPAPVLLPMPGTPHLGGRCAPNLQVTGPPAFRTDRWGYRGVEASPQRPAGTLRVAVAGGPFTFGRDATNASDLFGSFLQSLLVRNLSNRTIEVATVGPGAGVESVRAGILAMDLGLDIGPQALLWIVERDPCDPAGASLPWAAVLGAPEPDSAALAARAELLTRPVPPRATSEHASQRDAAARALALDLTSGRGPAAAEEGLVDAIAAVAARCQERGAAFTAIPLPHPLEADSELRALAVAHVLESGAGALSPRIDFAATSQLARTLRERGMRVLDLTPFFRDAIDLRRQDLIHYPTLTWNARAAELVASQAAAHLITSGALR